MSREGSDQWSSTTRWPLVPASWQPAAMGWVRAFAARLLVLSVALFVASAGLCSPTTVRALEPALRCEATKLKVAGKYGFCRLKAESKAAKTSTTPDFSKCNDFFVFKWSQAETAAGMGGCVSEADQAALQAFITQHTDDVAAALAGGPLPDCPGDLATCTGDLATCTGDLATCNANLITALACGNGVLDGGEGCDQANLNGQTCITLGFAGGTLTCGNGCAFDTSGCSSTRFVDNGDGTVTDTKTRLIWEKKQDLDSSPNAGDPHDADNRYTWSTGTNKLDGTAYTDFLYALNGGTSPDGVATSGCFTDHCDWRLPTIEELAGIVDMTQGNCGGGSGPCIDPTFGPTQSPGYWSATTSAAFPFDAWGVDFFLGVVFNLSKTNSDCVRAVRGA